MAVAAKAASSTTSKRRRNRHVEGTKPSTRIRCDSTEHSRRTRRRVLSGYPGSITGNAYGGTVQAPSETLASEATSFRTDEREPRADLYWLIAVSYTHLDVYKRQTYDTVAFTGTWLVFGAVSLALPTARDIANHQSARRAAGLRGR